MDHAKVATKRFKIVKSAQMKLRANIVCPAMSLIAAFASFATLSSATVGPECPRRNVIAANHPTSF